MAEREIFATFRCARFCCAEEETADREGPRVCDRQLERVRAEPMPDLRAPQDSQRLGRSTRGPSLSAVSSSAQQNRAGLPPRAAERSEDLPLRPGLDFGS